jgi:RHS repeat-associated protein
MQWGTSRPSKRARRLKLLTPTTDWVSLKREDNLYINKTIEYNYNSGGNITSKKEYAYTTGTLGTAQATISYAYGDANWKEKLTSYNGTAFTYDAIGNPLNYRNSMKMTWRNGRQLHTVSRSGQTSVYKYDDNGVRTSKDVNGITTDYFLNGDAILRQVKGYKPEGVVFETLDYFYDANGDVYAFKYNGTDYFYVRNGQGDIIQIINSSGNTVVTYTYDTWGKPIGSNNGITGDLTIGKANIFRYRGYAFDEETGFYYLNSRYYDPEIGRFVNSDILVNHDQSILGANLYAYCANNPVN